MIHRIFLSSVQTEFLETRKFLKQQILSNAFTRRFFDIFVFESDVPATDATTKQVYLSELARSDIYVGLIGDSYGAEDSEGISPTEREFDEATRLGIRRLIFVKGKDDSARSPKELAFLRKISPDLIRKRYTDDKDLLTELFSSLDKLLEQERMYRDLPFDKSPCFEAKFSDLSEEKIMWFLERARRSRSWNVKSNASPATILRKLHLYSEDGYLLNPALLLFGNDPQKFFTTSVVKCMHFHSTEKYKPIPSYQVYYGNLFDMIDSAVDFVMSKIDRRVGERTESPTAPVTYEIPLPVVMEAIVNAVSHRLYTSNGSVQVMLFSDRLEIANPGELIPSFPVEELSHDHESHPVNPHIAESFFLAQYAENVGSGTTDMIRICREAGLRPPVYQYEHGTFRTIIYRNTNRLSDRLSDQLSDKLSDRLSDKLSDRRIAILQKMIGDPQISLTDLAQQTGISRAAIIKNIAWLKENGYLKREGNNRQGRWIVLSGNDTPDQEP